MNQLNARDIFQKNLQKYMDIRHATQADIVSALHITASTMSDWYLGKKYPRVDSMQRLADFLDIPMTALTGSDPPTFDPFTIPGIERPHFQRVPLLGDIACGEPILAEENIDEYVNVSTAVKCDFVLRCKGNSMSPRLMEGDIVLIRQQPDVNDGQIAAVLIDNNATLKHVYHLPNRGGVQLVSDNPSYAPMLYAGEYAAEIRILGRAVAYQRGI